METIGDSDTGLKVAVIGCGHGMLDTIYATLEVECATKGWALCDLDLLIICGDFQAVRNKLDLNCMSVPFRYRKLGDFHKYYSGAAQAPVLTLVIGGNHEASNYHFELYHGGWLAPNIYYLGAAGVVRYGPWRIAGVSGIYNARNYGKPHGERLPYDGDDVRCAYHVREYDVQRLLHLRSPVDIALSHDWPAWVELFGDHDDFYATKPHFFASALADKLGSKPAAELLSHLRPTYWFSGHMHTRFTATVDFGDGLGMEDALQRLDDVPEKLRRVLPRVPRSKKPPPPPASTATKTEFLALDKVGSDPTFQWLELRNLDHRPHADSLDATPYLDRTEAGKSSLHYDEEWLAITRACAPGLNIADPETHVVAPSTARKVPAASVDKHRRWVRANIVDKKLLRIPFNFAPHAPVYDPDSEVDAKQQPLEYPNQQTAQFYDLLQIPNKFAV
ncbi:lariat debranching enzyme, C-terminal domain-containing protein [Lasiosphaeria miniovina]|uniref:Lariat debranching enzyme, C-terminal domain-containing protein n=1 Tax=Lasiosphaeria miniovina TaxID=1954250 RepID=A0AA40A6Q7_9PEZI|nr:lariat debranching enzyme, C-terminal domain-containing protein [Lasiosphaeria miniovina]KAK0710247.1 lariat debranching enzyme, C-terminal domain-containing protein [Lasiosphaeria miniovina]